MEEETWGSLLHSPALPDSPMCPKALEEQLSQQTFNDIEYIKKIIKLAVWGKGLPVLSLMNAQLASLFLVSTSYSAHQTPKRGFRDCNSLEDVDLFLSFFYKQYRLTALETASMLRQYCRQPGTDVKLTERGA